MNRAADLIGRVDTQLQGDFSRHYVGNAQPIDRWGCVAQTFEAPADVLREPDAGYNRYHKTNEICSIFTVVCSHDTNNPLLASVKEWILIVSSPYIAPNKIVVSMFFSIP